MPDLFGIDIAGLIHEHVSPGILDCTVAKASYATDADGRQQRTYATGVAAKGFEEEYSDFMRANGIPATDRKIIITQGSTTVTPERGDRVTISGSTYDVISVMRDPASATWTLQAR